jgi:endopeptidase La
MISSLINEEDLFFSDIIFYYLKQDYEKRTDMLFNLSLHTEKIYDNYIITTDDKKKVLIMINDAINNLNRYYNAFVTQLKATTKPDTIIIDDEKFINLNKPVNFFKKQTFKGAENVFDMLRKNGGLDDFGSGIKLASYKIIDTEIKKIMEMVGMKYIGEIIQLYKYNIDETYLELLNKIFIPISVKIYDSKYEAKKNIIISNLENTNDKYELLLENIYQIKLFYPNRKTYISIIATTDVEPLNILIRTSQICSNIINTNKIHINEFVEKNTSINKTFLNAYIKNLDVMSYLTYNKYTFEDKINEDFIHFMKYSEMNFKTIMSEFIQSSIKDKFYIIKLLLLGSNSSINIAALLFGITKDHKDSVDSNSKPTLISDIIYKNLKFTSQIKLKKSNSIIEAELEKIKSINPEDIDLKKQITLNKNMPNYVKRIALGRLEDLKSGNSEFYKNQTFIKKLIDFPWVSDNDIDKFSLIKLNPLECRKFIQKARDDMDSTVYGHENCKETIMELIGKWISNSNSTGKSIGLLGPPGVGKTLFAKALGKILDIPYTSVNIGGVDDGSYLTGHSFTYSSAQNGIIVDNMIKAGSSRCVMFFDEIDKAGLKHGINEIMNILIHLTDPNSNDKFNDKFFQEVNFPLNKVLFVFSYNDASKVDKVLLDRIEQIEVTAYSLSDKIKIFKSHLFIELCKDIDFNLKLIKFPDEILSYIIDSFTYEAGVRELKRKIEKILNKLNLEKLYQSGLFESQLYSEENPLVITKDLVDKYLDKPQNIPRMIHDEHEIGVINGLYATTTGPGGVLPIIVYKNFSGENKFKIKITGQQKSVMKESIQFAMTLSMNLLKNSFVNDFIKKYSNGIHVHTPDGSTPKDGPSAGAAFTTVFISTILNFKIKNNIAMTGEIDLNGDITAIGGLESKLIGAKKAGVNLVFVPQENEKDYKKILKKNSELFDDTFKIVLVDHISIVLDYCLIDPKITDKLKIKNLTYEKTFNSKDYLD